MNRCRTAMFGALIASALVCPQAGGAEPDAGARLVALAAGRPVTLLDLSRRLALRRVDPAAATREDWDHALESAINRLVLLDAAARRDIKITDEQVARALNPRLEPAGEEYREQARLMKLTEDQERQWTRDRLLIEEFVARKLATKVFVAPADIEAWYAKNKDLLATPEVRAARVITLRPGDKEGAAAVRAKMADIRKQAVEGAEFAALARANSVDPWAEKGGLLEPLSAGRSGSLFADHIFKMGKPGEISDVFETTAGVHIARLDEIRPGNVPTFKEAQETVRQRLRDELFARHLVDLTTELRRKTMVRVLWSGPPDPGK